MKSDHPDSVSQATKGFSLVELLMSMAVLSIIVLMVGQIIQGVQQSYSLQMRAMEAQNNARTAQDMIGRLIRLAGYDPLEIDFNPLDPDPDNNGVYDSIRVQSDWNPPDGVLDDPFEDVTITNANGILYTQEPGDIQRVEFVEDIQALTFQYFDRDNQFIANPQADPNSIVHVNLAVEIQPEGFPEPQTFSSGITLRIKEKL